MSLFDGLNIFLSSPAYPSKCNIGGAEGRNIYTAVPGIDGAFSMHMGWAPKQIIIEGIIGAGSVAALKSQIALIQTYVDRGSYVFVDNFGGIFTFCQMKSFNYGQLAGGYNSQITRRSTDFITMYRCVIVQLSPNANQV